MPDAGEFITPEDYNAALAAMQSEIDALTAIVVNSPGGMIDWAEQTADALYATDTSGEVEVFGLAFNCRGGRKISASAPCRVKGQAGDTLTVRVRDDDTGDVLAAASFVFTATDQLAYLAPQRVLAGMFTGLAAGLHTFRVTVEITTGTGPAGILGTPEAPSSLILRDEGTAGS